MIFVFGSNQAGIHGAGAALYAAKHHGAVRGVGSGAMGTCYAIPTKDHNIQTLPLKVINHYFKVFVDYAKYKDDLTFDLTPIGCGLAGYSKHQMLTEVILKHKIPDNVYFNRRWFQE